LEALSLAFTNKLDSADNKALKTIAKLHLPSSKKKGTATRKAITSPEEIMIGNIYIMEADIHNAYFGLTKDDSIFEGLMGNDLGEIIANNSREGAIKGDQFKIEGIYYEDVEDGASKKELKTKGQKVASAISIFAGPNKGKKAIMIHHKDLDNSIDIIKQIYEIN
jgi:hypothetical protein